MARQDDPNYTLRFGGGVHSRASEEDIDPHECTDAENGLLNVGDMQFRPRPAFDHVGSLPNAGAVRGGATLMKSDGTVTTLFQGADKVYEWDGGSNFNEVATVSATAKLRGGLEQNWQLGDKVIITDLNLVDVVYEWDGDQFATTIFTDENGNAFGSFKARYCYVDKERAIFANVSSATDTPHLIVASKTSDYTNITVANKPTSALAEDDPFYLIQPDLTYINGIIKGFGETIISSRLGTMYKLTGTTAKDYDIDTLLSRAMVSGDEAMALAADDIFFGRQGRIESVKDTDKSGDVELNDASYWISNQIESYYEWNVVTNKRLNRTYCHPIGKSLIWVMHESLLRVGKLSPWMRYTTSHAMDMNPNFMMSLLDPSDKLEYVFMGDTSGNIYRMEGTGSGDGGTTAIKAWRLSSLITPPSGKIWDQQGSIRYRKSNAASIELKFEFSGEHVMKNAITIDMPATSFAPVYGTTYYYGTQNFYGTDDNTLNRQRFAVPGAGTDLQVRATVSSKNSWTVNQIQVGLKIAG